MTKLIRFLKSVLMPSAKGNKCVPWSSNYDERRKRLIEKFIYDPKFIEEFRRNWTIPNSYGIGIDERCIEYPWVFSQLGKTKGFLLDAGSILNHAYIIEHPSLNNKNIHIMTLAPEGNCFWKKKISYLYSDLRDIPIKDNYYDEVICISVLEHIGCDNSSFSQEDSNNENFPLDFLKAIREMKRVLKPGGTLLFSVPYGKYSHYGLFQQFDQDLLSTAIREFGKASQIEKTFFRYSADGWRLALPEDCSNSIYVNWVLEPWRTGKWPDNLPVESDFAAAARAVACIKLIK